MLLNLIRHSMDDDMKTSNVVHNRTMKRTNVKYLAIMFMGVFSVLFFAPALSATPAADINNRVEASSDSTLSTTPNAAILLYHHVSSSTPASTSISPDLPIDFR